MITRVLSLICVLCLSGFLGSHSALADGGHWGGGYRGGGFYGGGFYGGGFYGYRGYGWGRPGFGVYVGPGFAPPAPYYPYYPYYGFPPAVISPPPVIINPAPVAPPVYIQQAPVQQEQAPAGNNWYYCYNPRGYYPNVQDCPGGWQAVPARQDDDQE